MSSVVLQTTLENLKKEAAGGNLHRSAIKFRLKGEGEKERRRG